MGAYKKILVVGNGFDLALKLPTSYKQFMQSFLRFRAELFNLPIRGLEENDFSNLYKIFADNMNLLKESWEKISDSSFNDILLKNQFIILMIFKYNQVEFVRSNYARPALGSPPGTPMYPEFPDIPRLSLQYYKEHDIADNSSNWFNVEDILSEISDINKFNKIASVVEKYRKTCHSLQGLYGNERIFPKNDGNKPAKYQELLRGLDVFKRSLAVYLSTVETYYRDKISENFKSIKKSLVEQEFDEIISLNYTSFAEQLFKIQPQFCHHPHGKINNDNPVSSEIVLGYYDDIDKDKFGTHFIEFQKFYQRILYGLGNYVKKDDSVRSIEFFGFSCDPADTKLLKELLLDDKDKIAPGLHKVIVHCFQDKNQNIVNLVQCIGKENILELTHEGVLEFKLDL